MSTVERDQTAEVVRTPGDDTVPAGEVTGRPVTPQHHRVRTSVAVALLVLVWILTPVAVAGVWLRDTLLDTQTYVDTVAPLSSDPAVQQSVADYITAQILANVDVQSLASSALPPNGQFLVQPLTNAVDNFVSTKVLKVVQSDVFNAAWLVINRTAHTQVINFLLDRPGGVQLVDNKVSLDLGVVIQSVINQLSAAGFDAVNRIPADRINRQFVVADADGLVRARNAVRFFQGITVLLPFLTLGLLGLAVLASTRRRRTLMIGTLGMAVSLVVLAVVLNLSRSAYLDALSSRPNLSQDAAGSIFDTIVRFLRNSIRTVFTIALLVALVAFLAGPSRAAVWVRTRGRRALDSARQSVETRGWQTGAVAVWIGGHKTLLRVLVIGLAAVLLVFLDRPTPAWVLTIAVVLVVLLAAIEVLGQSPRPGATGATTPPAGAAPS